jgi:hypothetical protein
MNAKKIVAILILAAAAAGYLPADGGFFIRITETGTTEEVSTYIEESSQRAFIYFDQAANQQRIVVEVSASAFSGEYAWLIPLNYIPDDQSDPSQAAQVGEFRDEDDLFSWLEELTAPEVHLTKHYVEITEFNSGGSFGCMLVASDMGGPGSIETGEDSSEVDYGVTSWGKTRTEHFDFEQITIDEPQKASKWLFDNGYGEVDESVSEILEYYGNSYHDFSFLIVSATRPEEGEDGDSATYPVSITYPAETPFFPMRISSIGAAAEMDLDLYLLTDRPTQPMSLVRDYNIEAHFSQEDWVGAYLFYDRGEPLPSSLEDFYKPYSAFNSEEEIPSVQTLVDLVKEVDLEQTPPLYFDQICALTISNDYASGEYTPDTFPFLQGVTLPEQLWIGKFSRTYYDGEYMDDIYFHYYEQDDFRSRIDLHAYIEVAAEPLPVESRADLGFIFPLLFPFWIGVRKLYKKIKKRG